MDIYRNGSDAFATLSLSNHDVKKLIEALDLDANVYVIRDKFFLDTTSFLVFAPSRRWEIRYIGKHFYRIPFYKEVYVSRDYPSGYSVISRCGGIDKWSAHSILFGNSVNQIYEYEPVFRKI